MAVHDHSMPKRLDGRTTRRQDKLMPNVIPPFIAAIAEIGTPQPTFPLPGANAGVGTYIRQDIRFAEIDM